MNDKTPKNATFDPIPASYDPYDRIAAPLRESTTLDMSRLKAAGYKNVAIDVREDKIHISYDRNFRDIPLFNAEALQQIEGIIGVDETEMLADKALRIFDRGIILSLLAK